MLLNIKQEVVDNTSGQTQTLNQNNSNNISQNMIDISLSAKSYNLIYGRFNFLAMCEYK